jgi:hypothetical protein
MCTVNSKDNRIRRVSRELRRIGEPRSMTKLLYGAAILLSLHQERKASRDENLPMRSKNTKNSFRTFDKVCEPRLSKMHGTRIVMEIGFHPNSQQQQGRRHVDGQAYTLIGRVRQDVEHTYPSSNPYIHP